MAPSARAPIGTLHFLEHTKYKAQKALIAAKFNGIAISENKFDVSKDSKKPEFLAKNASGRLPFLETDLGCVFSSNAIARYVARCRADTPLYGMSFDDECQIDTWLEFCTHELEVPLMAWVYPTLGLMQDVPQVTSEAKQDVTKALGDLEARLAKSKYVIGDFLSLADIALVCVLREGFTRVMDPAFRKPFPNVCAWFEACCALPQFKAVQGNVELCKEAAKAVAPKFAPPPRDGKPAEAKKEAAPKAAPKKEAKREAAATEKKAAPASAPAAPAGAGGDVEAQTNAVADELRNLKEKLKGEGLSGKKLNEHAEVKALVARLLELKSQAPAGGGAAPAAAPAQAPTSGSGDVEALVKAVADEIRTVKEKLQGKGLSGQKLFEHTEIKALVAKLNGLKAKLPPAQPASGCAEEAQMKAISDEIRAVKEKLQGKGISGQKLYEHAEIKALVAKLAGLKSKMPAGGAAAAPAAAAPAASPTPEAPKANDGDVEAQVKVVGDEIRALKEKLKSEGLSAKKINDNAEVKALVAKLTEIKAKQ